MAVLDEAETAAMFKLALDGDKAVYRHFLQKVSPVIRGIVLKKLPSFDPMSAEDVVQEVLLAIHSKRHTWQQDRPLLPWVYAITRYKSIDALRARDRNVAPGAEVDIDDIEEIQAPESRVDESLDVATAVGKLDGKLASVVQAVGVEGISIKEAGEQLSMSENAVRVAFHRGLKQLVQMRSSLFGDPKYE